MKNFTMLLIILAIFAFASQSFAQVTFGIRAGTNFANQLDKDEDANYADTLNYKMLPGGHLGFVLDISVNDAFSIETGLLLNTKGYKIKETDTDYKYVAYNYLAYIDLPINAKYTFDLGGPKFYIVAGPYFAYGFFGKGASVETIGTVKSTQEWDVEWGNDITKTYKHLDIGLNMGGGFQFGSFVIGATYGLGLKNISPYTDYGTTIKNRVLSISIGANFGN